MAEAYAQGYRAPKSNLEAQRDEFDQSYAQAALETRVQRNVQLAMANQEKQYLAYLEAQRENEAAFRLAQTEQHRRGLRVWAVELAARNMSGASFDAVLAEADKLVAWVKGEGHGGQKEAGK